MSQEMQNPRKLIRDFVESRGEFSTLWECKGLLLQFVDETDVARKANLAIENIRELIRPHQKFKLPDTLERLYHLEGMLRQSDGEEGGLAFFAVQSSRDHVIHALNTYLLGLLLKDRLIFPDIQEFDFQWKLAALFHDIGYPLEIAMKLINQSLVDPLNELVSSDLRGTNFSAKFELARFRKITTGEKSLNLLQDCIVRWDLNAKAQELYRSSTKDGKVKHGVISSLLLLAHIDLCYKEKNPTDRDDEYTDASWGRSGFRNFVVPPCSAIMLHDAGLENFKRKKIDKQQAPLAWLLRVADALQDWDRPKRGKRDGFPVENYRISIDNDIVEFKCHEDRIDSIRDYDLAAINEREKSIRVSIL